MKIVVTFSGLDPHRLAERIEQCLRDRRATPTTTIARLRSNDVADPPTTRPPRPANRRSRRDRRS
jgi:hypothetical protein